MPTLFYCIIIPSNSCPDKETSGHGYITRAVPITQEIGDGIMKNKNILMHKEKQ